MVNFNFLIKDGKFNLKWKFNLKKKYLTPREIEPPFKKAKQQPNPIGQL
jgi:hypothetical protein